MEKKTKVHAKMSLKEYKERQEARAKNPFKLALYPTPVLIALLIPFAIFVMTILIYILYIKGASE